MALVCIGLSYRTAPLEVREQHAFPPSRTMEALIALRDYGAIREAALISTCNRIEIYGATDDPSEGIAQLRQFLSSFGHANVRYDLEPYLYALRDRRAVEHLLRVATGLDSMLIGEAEILGQVKDAYLLAQRARSSGPTLHRLFRTVLRAGKEARSRTWISGASVSIATAAISLAKQHLGQLRDRHVVLVGAGKMGETAARRLKAEGAGALTIVNRTHARAADLVERLGTGDAVELPSLGEALASADVVVTSTGASHFVLDPGNVAEAMLRRPERPLLVIDIAVPRDVDPTITRIPNVHLCDIEACSTSVEDTLTHRREAIPLVEEIVAQQLSQFVMWSDAQETTPVIASLSQKAERIREHELERLFARCPTLPHRERTLITGMSMTIISKLLHSAVSRIREGGSDREAIAHEIRLLAELFDLELESQTAGDIDAIQAG
jgi:glutamyl-tRNA reductase